MLDYKKLIKSRKLRLAILRFLNFLPDKWMIRFQYRVKTGRTLNLKDPERFTEKLQWYKLYYRDPLMAKCVDKGDVREYVADCGCGELLNECYGIFDSVEEIDFAALPDSFVVKSTLGGGGNSVVIVEDKSKLDIPALKQQMDPWVRENEHRKNAGREWPYNSGRAHSRIIIEKYLDAAASEGGLIDYKFFCYNGEPAWMYVVADRELGNGAGFGIFDVDYNRMDITRQDERVLLRDVPKPENFDTMLEMCRKLSKPFPEVRVDLYNHRGKIIFGELTFFDGSGYIPFDPDEADYLLGEKFVLPERNN